jgi:hypothetical protein
MISAGATALYHSHEAGLSRKLRTHQTKAANFIPPHTCRDSVARSRSFTCERGVANPWSVLASVPSSLTSAQLGRVNEIRHPTSVSTQRYPLFQLAISKIIRRRQFLSQPSCWHPRISRTATVRASSANALSNPQASICEGMRPSSLHPAPGTWSASLPTTSQPRSRTEHATLTT